MKSDWILDVLNDLRTYAKDNDLLALAEQFDDIAIIALSEISSKIETERANDDHTTNLVP